MNLLNPKDPGCAISPEHKAPSGGAGSGFQGDYAEANWSFKQWRADGANDPPVPLAGFVSWAGAPATVAVTGIDDDSGLAGRTWIEITIPTSGTLQFDWGYVTQDTDPDFDPAGYVLDGSFTQLTNDTGSTTQSGTGVQVAVAVGQVFAFEVKTDDGMFGAATLSISNFTWPGCSDSFNPKDPGCAITPMHKAANCACILDTFTAADGTAWTQNPLAKYIPDVGEYSGLNYEAGEIDNNRVHTDLIGNATAFALAECSRDTVIEIDAYNLFQVPADNYITLYARANASLTVADAILLVYIGPPTDEIQVYYSNEVDPIQLLGSIPRASLPSNPTPWLLTLTLTFAGTNLSWRLQGHGEDESGNYTITERSTDSYAGLALLGSSENWGWEVDRFQVG